MVKNHFIFENDNTSAKEIVYRFGKKGHERLPK